MDDFGTGYSSLSYLTRFPVKKIKIDRSFIDTLGTNPQTSAIVSSSVGLGQSLDVTITAEGAVQIQTTDVPRAELISRLRAIAAERSSDQVFLRADGSIAYEQVMQVMGALNAGGFSNVGLVTDTGGPTLDESGE